MQRAMAIAVGVASGHMAAALAALAAWAEAERGRFFAWLPIAMGAGVVAHLTARADPPWWLGAAALCGGLLATILARSFPLIRAVMAGVAACGLGLTSAEFATWRAPPVVELPRHASIIEARVRVLELLPEGARITLEAPRLDGAAPLPRLLRIRLRARDDVALFPGDQIRVRAMVSPPSPPAYPGAWDLQRDAYFAGIGGYGFALGPPVVTNSTGRSGPALWLLGIRAAISARVMADIPGTDGAIAATLLTGFTSAIPEDVKQAFRDSGLAHLLAIAGLHIGIVMGLVLSATRLALAAWEFAALRWPAKQISVLAALAAGGAYMVVTGAHVPIMRSFSMACLVALAVLAGRRAVSVRGLALAAGVIMLIAPNEVLGVSFQLSFSAVLALITGYEALRGPLSRLRGRKHSRWRHFWHHIATLALTSALAGTASAPYGAYHFGRFQLYYVLANLIAVPITAMLVMPAGLLALALMPLHLEWLPLAAMAVGIEAIVWVGRMVAALPAAVLAVPPIPAWGLIVTTLGIAWLGIFRTRIRLAGALAIAVGIASPAAYRAPDVLMSADGRMIGVRTRAGAFDLARSGASKFTRDAWLQLWAEPGFTPLPMAGRAGGAAIDCAPAACALRPRGDGPGAVLLRAPPAPENVCAAALLISPEPIRLRCPARMPWVDRFSVWRNGAHAIWLSPEGVRILSDRENRGARPWVPPPPVPRAFSQSNR